MAKYVYTMLLSILCGYILAGCGNSQGDTGDQTKLLNAAEVKQTLRRLPYRYEFRPVARPDGAYSAVAGTAFGRYGTVVHFGIAFGRATKAVPVPRAGIDSTLGYRKTFIFTDDLQFRNTNGELVTSPQLETAAQWREAIEISVQITDRLCKSATGEPCPV
jgi:hypothetical protein